jgi:phosphoribosylanthranilate isomerase
MQSRSKNTFSKTNLISTPSPLERVGVRIKICGMKYPENIVDVGALLPDYMGFIFWEKSARYFDGEMPNLPISIKKVGVFVNASLDEILEKIKKYDLQAVQLHGEESVTFCNSLKKHTLKSIKVIKVFSILDIFDFAELKPYEDVCDFFLFDTKGKLPGGNGTTFDWQVLKQYPSCKPFFLSGGIGMEEIKIIQEISKTNLPIYAIDINSKFETEPGLKNIELLNSFKENLQLKS